jgi:hypothetical protein
LLDDASLARFFEFEDEYEDDNFFSGSFSSPNSSSVSLAQDTVFCHESKNKAIFIGKITF